MIQKVPCFHVFSVLGTLSRFPLVHTSPCGAASPCYSLARSCKCSQSGGGAPPVWETAWIPSVTLQMFVGSRYVCTFPGGHKTTQWVLDWGRWWSSCSCEFSSGALTRPLAALNSLSFPNLDTAGNGKVSGVPGRRSILISFTCLDISCN